MTSREDLGSAVPSMLLGTGEGGAAGSRHVATQNDSSRTADSCVVCTEPHADDRCPICARPAHADCLEACDDCGDEICPACRTYDRSRDLIFCSACVAEPWERRGMPLMEV